MLSVLDGLNTIRQEFAVAVRDKLSKDQWMILSLLTVSIIIVLFLTKSDFFLLNLLSSLFIVSTLTIIYVIRQYDLLRNQAEFWNWELFQKLFDLIGKPRYYPKELIDSGEITPPKGIPFRVVTYKGKYPHNTKSVEMLKNAKTF